VGKYRPVPRTLSEILRKVSQSSNSSEPVELISPEQLVEAGKAPLHDPQELFNGVTILPTPPEALDPEIRTPDQLFGKQAFAAPGKAMKSLQEMLPPRKPTSPLSPRPPKPDPTEQSKKSGPLPEVKDSKTDPGTF